jgi:hypothetical protein
MDELEFPRQVYHVAAQVIVVLDLVQDDSVLGRRKHCLILPFPPSRLVLFLLRVREGHAEGAVGADQAALCFWLAWGSAIEVEPGGDGFLFFF